MSDRVRQFDWSRTPLGPTYQWPATLRTAVETCLNSTTPALLWWGSDLINIYNDAHVPVLGDRHPALGRRAAEVWADVWGAFAEDVGAVMGRGVPVIRDRVRFDLNRGGWTQEMYFTYTLGPISDGAGGIGGLLLIGLDDTARVLAEREREQQRLRAERAAREAAAVAEANLARWQAVIAGMAEGVILCDADGNLIDWNRAALAMHGYASLDEARRHLADTADEFHLTLLDGRTVPFDRWPLSRLLVGESFTDWELRVRRHGSDREQIIAYSGTQIRDRDGSAGLALLTLHQVTDAARAGRRFGHPSGGGAVALHGESGAERIADELAEGVESMLHDMDLTLGERDFTTALGEHLVQEAIDAYLTTTRARKGYAGSCVAAAIAVALMIVRDPP